MPDDLRPPPESAHYQYHWIKDPYGALLIYEWDRAGACWLRTGDETDYPPNSFVAAWRYHGPCAPAALTINPDDAGQVERVARAMMRQRITELRIYEKRPEQIEPAVESGYFLCMTEARAVLKALSDA